MLKKYLVERTLPAIGASPDSDLGQMAEKSNEVIKDLGSKVQWQQSYIANDKLFCVYVAENEQDIRDHASKGGFPLDGIIEIKRVIDPTSASLRTLPYPISNDRQANMSPH